MWTKIDELHKAPRKIFLDVSSLMNRFRRHRENKNILDASGLMD